MSSTSFGTTSISKSSKNISLDNLVSNLNTYLQNQERRINYVEKFISNSRATSTTSFQKGDYVSCNGDTPRTVYRFNSLDGKVYFGPLDIKGTTAADCKIVDSTFKGYQSGPTNSAQSETSFSPLLGGYSRKARRTHRKRRTHRR